LSWNGGGDDAEEFVATGRFGRVNARLYNAHFEEIVQSRYTQLDMSSMRLGESDAVFLGYSAQSPN
jgi:hypothetical protein